ncbi:hypothetical protein [Streptomyces kebangsaanensis]|uniref:hypothetical protein n=1 Tax=Streptomyces kebangsaanensis TaxID=864058 RepID=UPI000A86EAF9|nr:hypothetical protein [Streptomyces kebangsaanensis]
MTDVPEAAPTLLPPAEPPRTRIIERTRHRYEDIQRLLEKRWTISATVRRPNLDRTTVRRFRDTDLDELPASARRSPTASTNSRYKSGPPARTSPGPATSPEPSPISPVTSVDTCYWSGSGRPSRTHRSP